LDSSRKVLLFCGGFGKICHLSIRTGLFGILLDPPEDVCITNMALAKDGIALGCICEPTFEERNREVTKLQFWSYPALCRAAGLE
jgi:hypothetical protein